MFERYDSTVNPLEVVEAIKRKYGLTQKKQAMAFLTKQIPLEKKFQTDVMKGLRKSYPDAYVVKISLAHYSTAGIPDVMCIYKGHYFGFELKRPVLRDLDPDHYGATKLQQETMRQIEQSGGTCAVVSYPEEAIAVIQKWEKT